MPESRMTPIPCARDVKTGRVKVVRAGKDSTEKGLRSVRHSDEIREVRFGKVK